VKEEEPQKSFKESLKEDKINKMDGLIVPQCLYMVNEDEAAEIDIATEMSKKSRNFR